MSQSRPSVLITVVGAINVLIGLASIALGVLALLAGADAVASLFDLQRGVDQAAGNHAVADAANVFTKGMSGIILLGVGVIAGCSIVQGLPNLLVGVGVICRSNLARIFAIIFAVLAVLEGLACLASVGQSSRFLIVGLVLIGYAVISFVALFGKRASFEFSGGLKRAAQPHESTAMSADVPPRSEAHSKPTAPALQTVLLIATSATTAIFATLYFMRPATPPIVVQGVPPGINEPRLGTVGTPIIVGTPKPKLSEFHDAVLAGQIPRAAELLKDIDVDESDEQGRTALMKVAGGGNRRMAMFLLGMGAQLNQGDKDGRTPLMYAVEKNQTGIIDVFSGRDLAVTHDIAAMRAQYKIVTRDGVNLNLKELIASPFTPPTLNYDARDKSGRNAYMQAFLKGDFKTAAMVYDVRGHSISEFVTESKGNTLLHLLIAEGNWNVVRRVTPMLFPVRSWAYADVDLHPVCYVENQTNPAGQEAWMLAAEKGHLEMVKHLMPIEPRIGFTTHLNNGQYTQVPTPLPGATPEGLKRQDNTGKTGFDLATANGHKDVVAYLTQLEVELTKQAAEAKAKKSKDGAKK